MFKCSALELIYQSARHAALFQSYSGAYYWSIHFDSGPAASPYDFVLDWYLPVEYSIVEDLLKKLPNWALRRLTFRLDRKA